MKKITEIKEILNELVDAFNEKSIYISGAKLAELGTMKIVWLDLMKRMHSNIAALTLLVPKLKEGNALALPVGLIIRTCIADSLTGFYLLTFSKDKVSFQNELNVMCLEYIGFLENLTRIEPLFQETEIADDKLNEIIIARLNEIVEKYPELVQRRDNFSILKKKPIEIRATSNEKIFPHAKKYPGQVTDLLKFERIFDYPGEGVRSMSYLYPLFRFYSQFHHYTILTRKLADMNVSEHINHLMLSIMLILQSLNSYGKEIEIPDELLAPFKNNLDRIYKIVQEEITNHQN